MGFIITLGIFGMMAYIVWFLWNLESAKREVRREDRDNW